MLNTCSVPENIYEVFLKILPFSIEVYNCRRTFLNLSGGNFPTEINSEPNNWKFESGALYGPTTRNPYDDTQSNSKFWELRTDIENYVY